jgi:hypothetical protein
LQTLTKHDVVGDLIYGTAFSYFALNNVQDEIAQQSADIVSYRAPSYGLFTTSLDTQYWFGVPRNVQFAGLSMDMDYVSHQTVDKNNDSQSWVNYNRSIGSRYSAMEHVVPEQMFSTDEAPAEGISAVKALALAAAEGQKVYTITQDNLYTALGQIQLDSDTEQEIANAVNAGREVTTHQYQINFNGWVGEGYIIIDPNTGAGAYKIAGGSNGGQTWLDKALGLLINISLFCFEVILDILAELAETGKEIGKFFSRVFALLNFIVTLKDIVDECSNGDNLVKAVLLSMVLTGVVFIIKNQ